MDKHLTINHAVDAGMRGMHSHAHLERPIIYSDIHQYVSGIESDRTAQVAIALKRDLDIRRQYTQLLQQRSRLFMPKAAAAASANIVSERQTDDFSIKVVAARGRQQHYVIIQVNHPDTVKAGTELVLHVIAGDNSARCNFPPLQDGRTQLVVDNEDPLMGLITHLDAEIYVN